MLKNINKKKTVSVEEANQDFSRVIHLADMNGQVAILQDNKLKYVLVDVEQNPIIEMTDDEKIDFVARRILKEHKAAFLELAK